MFLYIDASVQSVGSCLVQYDNDGYPHACGYMSYATNDCQKRWAPYQLELLALGLSLKQYETILLHSDLTVFTDNAVVASIQTYKAVNNREKRLLSYISQFPMTLRYVPGRKNIIADCLSRICEDVKVSDLNKFKPPPRLYDEEFILAVSMDKGTQTTAELSKPVAQLSQSSAQFRPVAATDKTKDGICRSKRIAERKLKNKVGNKLEQEEVSRSAADPVTSPEQDDTQAQNQSEQNDTQPETQLKTTNEILRELEDPNFSVDDLSIEKSAVRINDIINVPIIKGEDYEENEFFGPIYLYVKHNKLTGVNETDKKTLLLSENYFVEGDLLHKVSLPRARKKLGVKLIDFVFRKFIQTLFF